MLDIPVRSMGWLINAIERFNASCVKIRTLITSQSRIDTSLTGTRDTLEPEKSVESWNSTT